jgi:hypothetical protein
MEDDNKVYNINCGRYTKIKQSKTKFESTIKITCSSSNFFYIMSSGLGKTELFVVFKFHF